MAFSPFHISFFFPFFSPSYSCARCAPPRKAISYSIPSLLTFFIFVFLLLLSYLTTRDSNHSSDTTINRCPPYKSEHKTRPYSKSKHAYTSQIRILYINKQLRLQNKNNVLNQHLIKLKSIIKSVFFIKKKARNGQNQT